MNEHSSRSHSVFQLQIEGQNALTGESNSGVLNLIDLAGSERLGEGCGNDATPLFLPPLSLSGMAVGWFLSFMHV